VHDYSTVVSRTARLLLRSKITFAETTLARLLKETADYMADNARTFPIIGVLSQIEHNAKEGLPPAFRAPPENEA